MLFLSLKSSNGLNSLVYSNILLHVYYEPGFVIGNEKEDKNAWLTEFIFYQGAKNTV